MSSCISIVYIVTRLSLRDLLQLTSYLQQKVKKYRKPEVRKDRYDYSYSPLPLPLPLPLPATRFIVYCRSTVNSASQGWQNAGPPQGARAEQIWPFAFPRAHPPVTHDTPQHIQSSVQLQASRLEAWHYLLSAATVKQPAGRVGSRTAGRLGTFAR